MSSTWSGRKKVDKPDQVAPSMVERRALVLGVRCLAALGVVSAACFQIELSGGEAPLPGADGGAVATDGEAPAARVMVMSGLRPPLYPGELNTATTDVWVGFVGQNGRLGGWTNAHVHVGFEVMLYILQGRVRHEYGPGLRKVVENEAGDFIFIEPGVPHEVFNMSDVEPVVAVVARSDASEWENIVPYKRPTE